MKFIVKFLHYHFYEMQFFMERNWETHITGQWFNAQGYTLVINSRDSNTFAGDFCFHAGNTDKKIPIHGVIMPNENGHWPLVFMINWGNYLAGVEGCTCFQIDWNKNNKRISFDMQWTKVIKGADGEHVASGVLHFCQFDFQAPPLTKRVGRPHPLRMDKSPVVTVPGK